MKNLEYYKPQIESYQNKLMKIENGQKVAKNMINKQIFLTMNGDYSLIQNGSINKNNPVPL